MTPRKPGTDRRPQAGEARSSTGKPAPGGAGRLPGTAGVPRKVSRARGRQDLPRQRGGEPWSSPQDRACGKGGRPPNAASPPSLFLMGFYVATVLCPPPLGIGVLAATAPRAGTRTPAEHSERLSANASSQVPRRGLCRMEVTAAGWGAPRSDTGNSERWRRRMEREASGVRPHRRRPSPSPHPCSCLRLGPGAKGACETWGPWGRTGSRGPFSSSGARTPGPWP